VSAACQRPTAHHTWEQIRDLMNEFIYLFIVFQNPYTGVRPMDIGTVKV
jgi:hypothetical protein